MSVWSQIADAAKKLAPLVERAGFNEVVNAMSNHERNQWARAGYPGMRAKDPAGPAKFIGAPKLLYALQKEVVVTREKRATLTAERYVVTVPYRPGKALRLHRRRLLHPTKGWRDDWVKREIIQDPRRSQKATRKVR